MRVKDYGNERSWYDVMLVCEDGHQITSSLKSHPEYAVERCSECGAKTISRCPSCNAEIRGYHHVPGVLSLIKVPIPSFCHKCGKAYPWTSKERKTKSRREERVSLGYAKTNTVFIAHSFSEDKLIKGLKTYLEQEGFKWLEGRREDLGSISEDILKKIKESGFFIAVMTKRDKLESGKFTVSSWLIEEKGASLAFGYRPLIMVEGGIDRHYVGFLQSDDQLIYFERDEFAQKMIEAVNMIKVTLKKRSK